MKQSFSVSARAALLSAALVGLNTAAASADPLQNGVLECNVAPGAIIGSSEDISCVFHPVRGGDEYYAGRINRIGLELGVAGSAQFSRHVLHLQ
jgi:Protein of unknown function (DUF992)